jgi:hypothetical protein
MKLDISEQATEAIAKRGGTAVIDFIPPIG